jgi:hypothetical protein
MKKLFLLGILLKVVGVNAADLYVNNSGQAGTYTTISAAITSAVANDRIFVSPYGVYTEDLNIAKSLTITSAVANTRFSVVGSVTVTSAPNQDVVIIGGAFSGSITGNTGTATLATKGYITFSDCKYANFDSGNFIMSKVLFCESAGTVSIKHGKIIGSDLFDIDISDGPGLNIGDTILIIGNRIVSPWSYSNNDNYFVISNNVTIEKSSIANNGGLITINNAANSALVNNIFSNNYVRDSCSGSCNSSAVYMSLSSNVLVSNNIIVYNGPLTGYNFYAGSNCKLFNNVIFATSTNIYYNGGTLIMDNVSVQYSSNSINNNPYYFIDNLGRCTNNQYCVNQGSPALQYYDIDLTRNNRGTFGGPYSIDNYWNTATGRARVYDLTMPFEIWNGSTPSIKAEGTHIK